MIRRRAIDSNSGFHPLSILLHVHFKQLKNHEKMLTCPENTENIYLHFRNLNAYSITFSENIVDPSQLHKIPCSPLFTASEQGDL